MNKNLLVLLILFSSATLFGQQKEKTAQDRPINKAIKIDEIQTFEDSFMAGLDEDRKALKEFRTNRVYMNKEGKAFPISKDHLIIKFNSPKNLAQANDFLSNVINIKEIEGGEYNLGKNLALVELTGIDTFIELKNAINKLNAKSDILYAHYAYLADKEFPFGPTEGVLVKLKKQSDLYLLHREADNLNATVDLNRSFPKLDLYWVKASQETNYNSIKLADNLSKTDLFGYVENDFLVTPKFANTNDPSVSDQWGLNNDGTNTSTWGGTAGIDVQAFDAWGIATGSGIKVAVLDQGVDLDHPDLVDNLLPGYTAGGGGGEGTYTGSHGTACAGIVGAVGDNNLGVAGVAYTAGIIPVNSFTGTTVADIVDTFMWAYDDAGADITSNSWSIPSGPFAAVNDVFEYGFENGRDGLGVLNFFSSGNENSGINWPANTDSDAIIAVGGMSMCGERKNPSDCSGEAWGANYGDELDLVAPATKIHTTDIGGSEGYVSGDYTSTFNGTSASAPFAAGTAALVLSANPTMTATEFRALLEATCSKFGDYDYQADVDGHPNGTWHEEVGHGMINAYQAVLLADLGPTVLIDPTVRNLTVIEAEGCALYMEHDFVVRIGDYTGTDDPVVTVNVAGTATEGMGADYEIIGGNTVTFTGGEAQSQMITVRTYSDGMADAGETIEFSLSLDAGNTDAMLSDDENFTSTTWTVNDATSPEETAVVSFVDEADITLPPQCAVGELTLSFQFDNYPEETSWDIRDAANMVVASGGTYGSQPDGSTLDIPVSLTGGDYTLNLYDSWGDGFSTGASATLTDANGFVAASVSGNFGSESNNPFCVSGGSTFNGILQTNSTINEVENCGDDFAEYVLAVNLSECVTGEQDVTATIMVDGASTATEGDDFTFPSGKEVTFNGEGNQTITIPIRFIGDGLAEGTETLILNLQVSNEDLVDYGVVTSEITILDSDIPVLTISSVDKVRESDYDCESNTNLFEVTVMAEGCPGDDTNVPITLTTADGTVAMEGDDFNFVGSNTHTFDSSNIEEPHVFTIEVFNDQLIEGEEPLWLTIELVDDESASLANTPYEVIIQDPEGVSPPMLSYIFNEDFEDGLPEGWSLIESNDAAPNTFVFSENTDLNGMAVHVTSDPSTNSYDYVSTDNNGNKDLFLVSPLFELNARSPLDFLYQVQGEPGFFGAFDFGFAGLIGSDTDPTDATAIVNAVFGYLLLSEPTPTTLVESLGGEQDISQLFANAGFEGNMARLVFVWRSDYSVVMNPPLAVDDVTIQTGNYIESNKMIGAEIPSYPISESVPTYYYNLVDKEVAMMVESTSDHGCSSGYVYQAGTGTQQFISEYADEFAAEKTFAVKTENPDLDANLNVGLYYTEAEIAGWESATGKSRDELYMFKTNGYALGTCYSTNVTLNIEFDDFPAETTWEVIDDGTGVAVANGGPYSAADGASYTESWNLPEGNYTFTIFDAFGDGICCGFGNGSYTLTAEGVEIASGGAFAASESVSFCTSDEKLDLCNDYRDIEFAPVTFTPHADGYQLTASFAEGLDEFTGFGISAIPSFTPGELTAVQNQEQIEVMFENKYSEANISYYIFEEFSRDLEWIELETITPNGSGMYTVIDYFPYVGINRYRVAAVMANGDILYPCYEATEYYESTNDFDITPNPAVNDITIVISDANIEGELSLGIFDERGRVVMTEDLLSFAGVVRRNIDISNLAVGQYYVVVKNDNGFQKHATFIKSSN